MSTADDAVSDTAVRVSSRGSPRPEVLTPLGNGEPPVSVARLLRQERLKKGRQQRRPLRQRVRGATLTTASLLVIGGGAALLFLVPIVVDPAVATLRADFAPRPAACRTERVERFHTLSACGWSSCREGCTSDLYRCLHVYVSYVPAADEPAPPPEAVLLINVKTCGYPPRVNCSAFELAYGVEGREFPCYVSRANLSVTVTDFREGESAVLLAAGVGAPAAAILLGAITVALLQLQPACWKRRKVGHAESRPPVSQRVWSTSVSPGSSAAMSGSPAATLSAPERQPRHTQRQKPEILKINVW
ncbi:uncharacterized protein LOC119101673 [Pollicipes pollicipes]|uniref:uncharacterized protein LOC119101673 n=1 Tax=Pollicipes pollicipes TaxID=41117 RepID=UPI0018856B86|nr:uncharacterized protein LOC119101673 [Pollicipes pollicipes]